MKLYRTLTMLILLACTSFVLPPDPKTRIWLIGDSTMSDKEIKAFPETGWGMPFSTFFDSSIIVSNRAKNGRSTRSYMAEGLWNEVLSELRTGDYVLIQFGHNDEGKEKAGRYTTPEEFEAYLCGYVTDTRSKGANPVLLTPVARRSFSEDGIVRETHLVYAAVVRKVADSLKVPLIDLDQASKDLLQQFGSEQSKWLFNYLDAGEHPNYPQGKADNTHFNELGARKIAELVLEGIRELHLPLNSHIRPPLTSDAAISPQHGNNSETLSGSVLASATPANNKTWIVAKTGKADFRTVQAALDAIPLQNRHTITIYIKNGVYREKLHLDSTRDHVTLIGEDKFNTILTYDDHPGKILPNGDSVNTLNSRSFLVVASDVQANNITFRNDAGFTAGQAVALEVRGDRERFINCRIIGNQDILFLSSETSRQYYDHCYLEGTTDFIFGAATAWFNQCHIHSKKNSHVTAASTPKEHPYGFIFYDCVLTGDSSIHNASLGRPWRPYACVAYLHCYIDRHIRSEGWSNWNNTDSYKTARYAEYDNYGPGSDQQKRVPWAHQLSDEEAKQYSIRQCLGDWDPTAKNSWEHLPEIIRPLFKQDTCSITSYGAISGLQTLNTASINAAILDCSRRGGGVVLIPAGYWLTGPIQLQSGVNLHLERAAILQFTADFNQYPLVAGNWEGHPSARCQSPITGTNLENIAITGTGVIDGNGDAWRMAVKDKYTGSQWKQLVSSGGVLSEDGKTWYPSEGSRAGSKMKNAGVLEPGKSLSDFETIKDFLRPNLLVLTGCRKVLLEGVTFQNSPAWCLHPLLCEQLTVQEVHVRNPWNAQNGDGIDIESCRHVLVANSTFDAGDDGICLKSGRDEAGRKRDVATEDVIITNDIVYHAHGGVVIGSEMSGGVRNIFVDNCSFMGTDIGLRFKTVRGRGGVVEKIFIKNIFMKDIVHQAIFLDMYYFARSTTLAESQGRQENEPIPPVTEATPQFSDIHISHVVCDGAEEGIFIRGLPEMNIREIYLDDLYLSAGKGAELIAAKDITLRNIRLRINKGNSPANATDTAASAVKTPPLIYVENSRNLHFDSLSFDKTIPLVFSINGRQCAHIGVNSTSGPLNNGNVEFNYGAEAEALLTNKK